MSYYYICDRCGSIVTITDERIPTDKHDWACAECGSETMWEFASEEIARSQGESIRRRNATGVFRSTSNA